MSDPGGWLAGLLLDVAGLVMLAALFAGAVWAIVWLVDRSDRE